jgi:hypothetical protein
MNVEPALAYFSEAVFDDFLKAADPTLLTSVEPDLSDGA